MYDRVLKGFQWSSPHWSRKVLWPKHRYFPWIRWKATKTHHSQSWQSSALSWPKWPSKAACRFGCSKVYTSEIQLYSIFQWLSCWKCIQGTFGLLWNSQLSSPQSQRAVQSLELAPLGSQVMPTFETGPHWTQQQARFGSSLQPPPSELPKHPSHWRSCQPESSKIWHGSRCTCSSPNPESLVKKNTNKSQWMRYQRVETQ